MALGEAGGDGEPDGEGDGLGVGVGTLAELARALLVVVICGVATAPGLRLAK